MKHFQIIEVTCDFTNQLLIKSYSVFQYMLSQRVMDFSCQLVQFKELAHVLTVFLVSS